MMSAAQRMCAAQRRNENTPEAFAFPGCFFYAAVVSFMRRSAHHFFEAKYHSKNIICTAISFILPDWDAARAGAW